MRPLAKHLLIATAVVLFVSAAAVIDWLSVPTTTSYANPYSSPQPFMEGIYAAEQKIVPTREPIGGVIVPHHLVAAESIASGIKVLQGQTFKKIVLLSPDHFFRCPTTLCTTNARFETIFGDVGSDPATVEALVHSPLLSDAPDLFKQEHGIYAVLPFIDYYFPGLPVTPLVFSQEAWKDKQKEILALFERVVDNQTMLIVSSDFSHYLTYPEAEIKDAATIATLLSGDLDGIAEFENPSQSDCPNCLWALSSLIDRKSVV